MDLPRILPHTTLAANHVFTKQSRIDDFENCGNYHGNVNVVTTSCMIIFFSVYFGKRQHRVMAQVWSLSSFGVSCHLLTNDLNQLSSVSLLTTASTALANKGFLS